MEEVSCSDDEPKITSPTTNGKINGAKTAAADNDNGAVSSKSKKKVSPPSAGKKQGSILNFFTKK